MEASRPLRDACLCGRWRLGNNQAGNQGGTLVVNYYSGAGPRAGAVEAIGD